MIDKQVIGTLIEFNFWANDHILTASERLSAEEFTRQIQPDPGWGDLRSILVHILDTEYGWRSTLQSQKADDILAAADFPDVESIKARWELERTAWLQYADELSAERLGHSTGDGSANGMKVWQTILHVIAHGIQHRSEAAMILTGYGQSPGELDFDVFLQEKSSA
jgi:uncharacterized damage-inducible protein DinB